METEGARRGPSSVNQPTGSAPQASLRLELRVPDKQALAAVRDALLRWINDRTGPLARATGFGDRFSLDEQPPTSDAHGMSTMRLTVSWPVAKPVSRVNVNSPRPVDAARGSAASQEPAESFVFVSYPSLADAPLHADFPDETPEETPEETPQERPQETLEPYREPYPRLSRRPRPSSVAVRAAARIAGARTAIHAALRQSLRGLGTEPLMIRVPALATDTRVRSLTLLGSTIVVAGLLVGSVHLGTSGRPATAAMSPASQPVRAMGVSNSALPSAKVVEAPTALAAIDDAPRQQSIVASADVSSRPARIKPQPIEQHDKAAERSQRAKSEAATAPTSKPVQTAPAPEVATTGFAVPGGEAINSAPQPEKGRARGAKTVAAQVAVVRAADDVGLASSGLERVKGALLVKSDPQGAEVSINGVVHGRTPLMIRDLSVGSRVVRLELPGYERWSWAVSVVANKQTPLNVKLRRESRAIGKPD
jgi:hypothetical protein